MYEEQRLVPDTLRRKVAEIARATGKSEETVVREAIEQYFEVYHGQANGLTGAGGETLYDMLVKRGSLGCSENGPADLSTNPRYLEGFGEG